MAAPDYTLRKRPLGAKLTTTVTVTSRLPQIILELDQVAKVGVEEAARDIAEEAGSRAPDATPFGEGLKYAIDVVTEREGSYVVAGRRGRLLGALRRVRDERDGRASVL